MRILVAAIVAAAVGLAGSYHFAKPTPDPVVGSMVMLPMPPHKPKDQERVSNAPTLCVHRVMGC